MLILHYPPFRANDAEELLRQSLVGLRRYVLELDRYGIDALEKGWSAVLVNHKTERWPTIGAIVSECEAYSHRPGPVLVATESSYAEREGLANKMLHSFTGHEAAREGWCENLRLFVMDKAREPTDAEIVKLRADKEGADATYRDLKARQAAGEDMIAMETLDRVRAIGAERERDLAARILGNQADAAL